MALFTRAPLLCAAFFAIAPLLICALVEDEMNIPLYIHQVSSGAGTNQAVVVQGSSDSFGTTAVTDWPVLDGPPADPSAKVVGRARGFHMLASPQAEYSWFTAMNLVFKDESRYNGSTLAVIGTIPFSNEWSIVGGTGALSMARGIVKYTVDPSASINGKRLYKILVHVVCVNTGCNCNTKTSEPIVKN
ncbi:pterocarpan synthase 1-like [Miscanthus floridulus]|uniref:pterocarpan synthase 1-like n=1 Tax=Miscanthus floridulus TaxID=154761 RepID=UPI00345A06C0